MPIHNISVEQTVSFLRGLRRERKGLKTSEGRSLGFVATRNTGKRVAVYYQHPGDAERSAQPSSPLPARPRLPHHLGRTRARGRRRTSPPQHARATRRLPARRPSGHQHGLLLNTCVHPACCPSRITSEAWIVVSGPNLSDFDGAPAQSRQDQTLAQEVAARVAERVRLSRHVRALRKAPAAGVKELLTRAGVATQAAAATVAVATRVPSRSFAVPARPRGLEQEDGETRHRVRGERGGAGDRLPLLPLPATPPGAVGGPIPARAAIGLRRIRAVPMPRHHWPGEARRCLGCVAIGPRWSWAVPGPRQQRAAGGAGRGGLRAVRRELAFRGTLCGVSPRVEARGGDLRGRVLYLASLLTSATGM